jgi:hypothetical protein
LFEDALDMPFNAVMTPMRANIVGPPEVATKIKASIPPAIPRPRVPPSEVR